MNYWKSQRKKIEFICRNKKSSMSPKHEKVILFFQLSNQQRVMKFVTLGAGPVTQPFHTLLVALPIDVLMVTFVAKQSPPNNNNFIVSHGFSGIWIGAGHRRNSLPLLHEGWRLEMPPSTCLVVDVSVASTSAWLCLLHVGFLHELIALERVLPFKLFHLTCIL